MPNRTVDNECLGCGHTWLDKPGQHAKCYHTGCPDCGSLYWKMTTEDDNERGRI